jgi:hypothetical protein
MVETDCASIVTSPPPSTREPLISASTVLLLLWPMLLTAKAAPKAMPAPVAVGENPSDTAMPPANARICVVSAAPTVIEPRPVLTVLLRMAASVSASTRLRNPNPHPHPQFLNLASRWPGYRGGQRVGTDLLCAGCGDGEVARGAVGPRERRIGNGGRGAAVDDVDGQGHARGHRVELPCWPLAAENARPPAAAVISERSLAVTRALPSVRVVRLWL